MKGYITDYNEKIRLASQALATKIESQEDVRNIFLNMEELKSFMIKQHSIIENLQGQLELAEAFSNPRLSEKVEEQNLYIKRLEQQLRISKSNEKMYLSEWTKTLNEKQALEDKVEILNLKIETLSINDSIRKLVDPIPEVQSVARHSTCRDSNIKTLSESIEDIKDISDTVDTVKPNVGNTYNTYNYYGESRTYNRYGQINTKV